MSPSDKLIVLDRDGVINYDSADYIKSPQEWRPLPGSLDAIAALTAADFRIVVISNQSGLARGLFTEDALARIHAKMTDAVEKAGGKLTRIYFCPHHPDDGCHCRKPRPGMLERMQAELGGNFADLPVVGDKDSDLELARRVGARPILVRTGYGSHVTDVTAETYPDLATAAAALIGEAGE